MTVGAVLAVLGPVLAIALALVKWWLGPKYKAWNARKAKDRAHKANDQKDGSAILEFFIRRRRK